MNNSIADIRKDYTKRSLEIAQASSSPIEQFKIWFQEAVSAAVPEPNAMNLSTISADGKPASRIVLLKGIEDGGFTFFTNYESRKGREMSGHPFVAITFFWPELERQVRIEGRVSRLSDHLSDVYFKSRPRGSQVGAWVSPQSHVIASREMLIEQQLAIEQQYENQEVPRPPHWGGYLVTPALVEFWQGRPSRLHDRIQYTLHGEAWKLERLAP